MILCKDMGLLAPSCVFNLPSLASDGVPRACASNGHLNVCFVPLVAALQHSDFNWKTTLEWVQTWKSRT